MKYLVDEVKVDPLAKAKGGMTTLHAAVTAHQVSITKVKILLIMLTYYCYVISGLSRNLDQV